MRTSDLVPRADSVYLVIYEFVNGLSLDKRINLSFHIVKIMHKSVTFLYQLDVQIFSQGHKTLTTNNKNLTFNESHKLVNHYYPSNFNKSYPYSCLYTVAHIKNTKF